MFVLHTFTIITLRCPYFATRVTAKLKVPVKNNTQQRIQNYGEINIM